jgi:hypothetical protein
MRGRELVSLCGSKTQWVEAGHWGLSISVGFVGLSKAANFCSGCSCSASKWHAVKGLRNSSFIKQGTIKCHMDTCTFLKLHQGSSKGIWGLHPRRDSQQVSALAVSISAQFLLLWLTELRSRRKTVQGTELPACGQFPVRVCTGGPISPEWDTTFSKLASAVLQQDSPDVPIRCAMLQRWAIGSHPKVGFALVV